MKHILTLLIVAVLASTSFAQETATKEMNSQVMRIKKLLEPVTLTPEQETSFSQAAEKLTAELAKIEEGGLTPAMLKTREEKRKEGRKSKLKGKELQAHISDGLTAEELELFATYSTTTKAFDKTVASMLTDEQMSALPKKAQKKLTIAMKGKKAKGGKGKGGKGKKKKKKKAAADE